MEAQRPVVRRGVLFVHWNVTCYDLGRVGFFSNCLSFLDCWMLLDVPLLIIRAPDLKLPSVASATAR